MTYEGVGMRHWIRREWRDAGSGWPVGWVTSHVYEPGGAGRAAKRMWGIHTMPRRPLAVPDRWPTYAFVGEQP